VLCIHGEGGRGEPVPFGPVHKKKRGRGKKILVLLTKKKKNVFLILKWGKGGGGGDNAVIHMKRGEWPAQMRRRRESLRR